MAGVNLLLCITERRLAPDCEKIFAKHGVHLALSAPASGTASNAMLEYLGLDRTEKTAFFLTAMEGAQVAFNKEFQRLHRFRSRNNGIMAEIPLSSIGGATVMQYMTQDQENEIKEGNKMDKQAAELIIVIANSGYNDQIMKAAREGGAHGGTVVHAKSADVQYAEQFFGVSLSPEKEMVFIIARTEDKHSIMRHVMEKAGMATKARSIVFSVPLSDVQGVTLSDEE